MRETTRTECGHCRERQDCVRCDKCGEWMCYSCEYHYHGDDGMYYCESCVDDLREEQSLQETYKSMMGRI